MICCGVPSRARLAAAQSGFILLCTLLFAFCAFHAGEPCDVVAVELCFVHSAN